MDLSPYINQLREDLTTAAAAGDDQTRQTAATLSASVEPATRLALMNALSDLAAEITTQLDGQVVDVRLDGRDIRVVVTGSPSSAEPEDSGTEPAPPPSIGEGGDISRITLRLLDEIKGQAEQAASTQGVSLNTWVAQAVQNALHGSRSTAAWDRPRSGSDQRQRPWGQSGGRNRRRGERTEGPGTRIRGWVQG
ncbi:HicB-like protein involved in pilus formation [Halopolyspora algeriensis]|uniref:HicB-like protein involved in pilus formation n=1 Tax=Halopolyspora algeriensis TaxID=1500506 RepID=A0A368VTM4_9ACTN|nr:toxin-antitoxin system HicB family antitoxin [Halopolyspora algeriensis]RCW43336.1 HicB-like protein involved in pilus formation [Halopolyspora algeriensis]TQM56393.1 HicB-like protein involved in pilus formation [Halopolyspora algeriensis]